MTIRQEVHRRMEEETCRVILHRIGDNTEQEKARFCEEVSKHYGIPFLVIRKIVDRCPVVIKKDLPLKKAELLAIALQSTGASVSVERKRNLSPVFLEFTGGKPYRLGLESFNLRKSPGETWQAFGRVQNIFKEELRDIWTLIQVFDEYGDLVTFEEVPLSINPLPPNESSPFKAIFEKYLPLQKISIAFKTASGNPVPAMDRRRTREWVEVRIAENGKSGGPLPAVEISGEVFSPLESSLPPAIEANEGNLDQHDMRKASMEVSPLAAGEISVVSIEKVKDSVEELAYTFFDKDRQLFEQDNKEELKRLEILKEEDPSQEITQPLVVKETQEEENLHLDFSTNEPMEGAPQTEPALPLFEKEESIAEEKLATSEPKIEGKPTPYPWLDEFKRVIEVDAQEHRDLFLPWFEDQQKEGKFEDPYHSLLTLLIYARFNQTPSSDTALANTQTVCHLMVQTGLSPEQIPPLKGDLFFPSDIWRELYIRAIPKLQEVARRILEEMKWEASDLDRLIRIIPHMTARNSRWVIRILHGWIPGSVPDVSGMPVDIDDGLYRLASRLGVVNPLFDYYQGKNSTGDLKIQSFAKTAFPDDPGKIEGPMSRLGTNDEEGHCLPTQPKCQNCPLGNFCPKLFIDFDPSEKGMILRPG